MVHLTDVSWGQDPDQSITGYSKGQRVRVKVLDIDPEKERISLGIKQLTGDPFEEGLAGVKKGDVITVTVGAASDKGLEVTLTSGLSGFIKKVDLSRDREYQKPERFAEGEKVDAKVVSIDKATRKIHLSIKALEIAEEEKALSEYGSTDSGASLGDILGEAMKAAKNKSTAE
jgi:small subunit ribosomal protein S1